MKPLTTSRLHLASWSMVVLAALALAGCGGSDGATGPAGSSGTNVGNGITTGTTLTAADNSPGVVLNVTGITGGTGPSGTFKVGDKPSVTFTIKKTNGVAWYLTEMANARIWLSGPTSNYQRVIAQQSDVVTKSVLNADGSYTYTFASGIPANYLTPLYGTNGVGADNLGGTALLDGPYTIAMSARWNYTVDGAPQSDFAATTKGLLIGATAVSAVREVVKNDNCNVCHTKVVAHGGNYRDTATCVTCHTAGAMDRPLVGTVGVTPVEFKVMIHKIHNGVHLPSVVGVGVDVNGDRDYTKTAQPYQILGYGGSVNDFSGVVFPVFPSMQNNMPKDEGYAALTGSSSNPTTPLAKENAVLKGVVACYKCHGDPDGPTGPMTAPSQGANHTTVPTQRACGSCHDDIDWAKPYKANGLTMAANQPDGSCASCHNPTGTTAADAIGGVPSTHFAHVHPLSNGTYTAGVTDYTTGVKFNLTKVTKNGPTDATNLVPGDKPVITFAVTNAAGTADVALGSLSAISTTLVGPTTNRQLVFPMQAPKSSTYTICDFSGRLVSGSSSGKGSMSRVINSAARETLKVQFTSATAFDVTATDNVAYTYTNQARGSGALPGAGTSSVPTGAGISNVELGDDAAVAAGGSTTYTVNFTSSTAFDVKDSGGATIGSGTLPNTCSVATGSNATRFTSPKISFTVTSGTAGNEFSGTSVFNILVYRTSVNNHLFAIVAGKTAFGFAAPADRFYYEAVPAAATYTFNLPMDIPTEFLGNATAASGDNFTAGNLPVYWGRETVYERTWVAPAVATVTTQVTPAIDGTTATIVVADTTGFAANDVVAIEPGVVNKEESATILSITNGTTLVLKAKPKAHANNSVFKKVVQTTLSANVAIREHYIPVTDPANFVAGDYVVLDQGVVGKEEYLLVGGKKNGTQVGVTTPLRYAHTAGATCSKAVLTARREGTHYTLDVTTQQISTTAGFTAGNAVVVSYRTDGCFGWKRAPGDTLQTAYQPPMNDSTDLGEQWGDWSGLQFQDGTYTAAVWGSRPIYVTPGKETQVYNLAADGALKDFLYGSAATIEPYGLVKNQGTCAKCHDELTLHGGSRKGNDTCLTCHAVAGGEDWPLYANPSSPNIVVPTEGVTINFRTMLHKIHMGEELTNASSYQIVGNGGNVSDFEEIVFPVMQGKAQNCEKCHGAVDAWKEPAVRAHAAQTVPTANWKAVCNSCHDSDATTAHITAMTTGGVETCTTCHGVGKTYSVETVHKAR